MKKDNFNRPTYTAARKRLVKENVMIEYKIDEKYSELGKGKKYVLYTFGCQGNEADSEKIRGLLEAIGFEKTDDELNCDFILLNTCAIRETAENKVFGELGRLKGVKKNNPNVKIGICGCMPQEEITIERILNIYRHVDLVFGTHNIHNLPEYLYRIQNDEKVVEVMSFEGNIVENVPLVRENAKKAWVNIMYGCDEFCTYCIVPYTRGKERSRNKDKIIEEVRGLKEQGYAEVTLLGQNVNSYGRENNDGYEFADLMEDLAKTGISRIRFTTSHPKDFDDRLIDVISRYPNIMPYIHLPVQSGSTSVLKKMNRKYTKEEYLSLVDRIYEKIPHVSLTTDIIVAFPTETEEDFNETLDLVRRCRFEGAYTFIFSPRKGTPAYSYENNIPEEEKKRRLQTLNELVNEGYLAGNKRFENKVVKVLVEGISKNDPNKLMGYTENNKLINFTGDVKYIGTIVNVLVTEVHTWSLNGEMINE